MRKPPIVGHPESWRQASRGGHHPRSLEEHAPQPRQTAEASKWSSGEFGSVQFEACDHLQSPLGATAIRALIR